MELETELARERQKPGELRRRNYKEDGDDSNSASPSKDATPARG